MAFEGAGAIMWETSLHQEAALGRGDCFATVALCDGITYGGITNTYDGNTLDILLNKPCWRQGYPTGRQAHCCPCTQPRGV